jgi:thiol-disulfide isomerase/thioredoxin
MRKLLTATFLFLITISVQAAEIIFLDNPVWSTVLEKAKKENKMIFLDGYATWCGPCKKMDSETYKDQAVADYYNANFINVRYDMEKGEGKMLAEKYDVTAYPYLIFTDPAGVILHKGVGFLEAADFVSLGKAGKDPSTQYFTLKKKAMQLPSAEFEKFVATGVNFEDEEIDDLMDQYLSNQSDILGDQYLMRLVMEHVSALPNEKMLAYFAANKAKLIKGGYSEDQIAERMVSLTLGHALSPTTQTDPSQPDFTIVEGLLTKYTPEKAYFVLHYFKAQFALDNKKYDEALTELNLIADNTPVKVNFDQLCNAAMGMAPELEKQGKAEAFLKKFDAVTLPAKDADKAYMKEFVRAIIAIKNGDMEKFKTLANQMLAKPSVPAAVKEDLKSALGRMNEKN